MKKSMFRRSFCAALSAAMLLGVCACSGGSDISGGLSDSTTNLMANVKPEADALSFGKNSERQRVFEWDYDEFALSLFRKCAAKDPKKNALVSPLSVLTALAMTQNGAEGETLEQMNRTFSPLTWSMDSVLSLNREELNQYLGAYLNSLPSGEKARLTSANSIWLRENSLQFKNEFLQTNADFFGADIFSSRFDEKTLADINKWVSDNTDGMIPSILDVIPADAVMYLINALSFDAEWENIYSEDKIFDGEFTNTDGKTENIVMMGSDESCYLDDGSAKGFVKPYASGYSFVAMLPDEEISLEEYVQSMRYDKIAAQIRSEDREYVHVSMPKFSAEYSTTLNEILSDMGMTDAFDPEKADFSGMADVKRGDLFISRVIHKTAINVDERGTKAGAVTAVEMTRNAVMMNLVSLDRPFVYMIIDNQSLLPVFIGQVTHIK